MAFSGRSFFASTKPILSIHQIKNFQNPHTHIILTQMDTLYTSRNGDINTIIDQQRNTIFLGNLVQFFSRFHLNGGITFLISILDNCDPYINWLVGRILWNITGGETNLLSELLLQPSIGLDL